MQGPDRGRMAHSQRWGPLGRRTVGSSSIAPWMSSRRATGSLRAAHAEITHSVHRALRASRRAQCKRAQCKASFAGFRQAASRARGGRRVSSRATQPRFLVGGRCPPYFEVQRELLHDQTHAGLRRSHRQSRSRRATKLSHGDVETSRPRPYRPSRRCWEQQRRPSSSGMCRTRKFQPPRASGPEKVVSWR